MKQICTGNHHFAKQKSLLDHKAATYTTLTPPSTLYRLHKPQKWDRYLSAADITEAGVLEDWHQTPLCAQWGKHFARDAEAEPDFWPQYWSQFSYEKPETRPASETTSR